MDANPGLIQTDVKREIRPGRTIGTESSWRAWLLLAVVCRGICQSSGRTGADG